MSVALFNEPIEIEVMETLYPPKVSRQGLLLGIITDPDGPDLGITVNEAGYLFYSDLDKCRTKWRYDSDLQDWDDHSGPDVPEVTEPT